ncbi:MAG TPA: glycosyltransferase family 39 protein [Acetobacteraceae bacterium]|nr:glycosyltransferase family 39 protein [Acetobacteraceae bacterium]
MLLTLLFIAIGALRIGVTWPVFTHTYDEPAHLATGIEWLDRGTYRHEPQHPPLARVALALGPWLDGLRAERPAPHASSPSRPAEMWFEGGALLHGRGEYQRTLTLARAGILPFFVLAAALVWWWTQRQAGPWAACIATGLFSTLPVILGHAGLATTDMAFTAVFLFAILALRRWLEAPGTGTVIMLGIAVALAVLTKFTVFPFFGACLLAILAWRFLLARRGGAVADAGWWRPLRSLPLGILVGFVTVWAGYRFSLIPLSDIRDLVHLTIDSALRPGAPRDAARRLADTPIPLAELVYGLATVAKHSAGGHLSYLLGEYREGGWWQFFPVAVLVKTPLAFLLLAGAGIGALLGASWRRRDWRIAVPALCVIAIMASVLPSRINIGVRHVLPIFPFLAIAAGIAAVRIIEQFRRARLGVIAVAALLAWHVASGARAGHDQLTYFNELADRAPERVLLISDLDWGQDVHRLADVLRALNADSVAVFLLGQCDGLVSYDLSRHGLPPATLFLPGTAPRGHVAVSMAALMSPQLAWLRAQEPVATAGRSIRVYRVTDPPVPGPAPSVPCGVMGVRNDPLAGWVTPSR